MSDVQLILIQTTMETYQQAETVAMALIDSGKVACVQIQGPITSIYRWQGNVEKHDEFVLVAKGLEHDYLQVEELIKRHHTYEVPEIIAIPVSKTNADYLKWVTSCYE